MKTHKRSLTGFVVVALLFVYSGAEAGSYVSRSTFTNLNMVSWLGDDRVMTLSVWENSTHTVERHGGRPITKDFRNAGWRFLIRTCPVNAEPCIIETDLSGDLGPDDIAESDGKIRMTVEGVLFECAIDRRAKSSSSRRNQYFDGSSEESSHKTNSVEGRGFLSGSEGLFEGYCYGNKGTSRQETVN